MAVETTDDIGITRLNSELGTLSYVEQGRIKLSCTVIGVSWCSAGLHYSQRCMVAAQHWQSGVWVDLS